MRAWKKITDDLAIEIGQESVLLWLTPLVARVNGESLKVNGQSAMGNRQ